MVSVTKHDTPALRFDGFDGEWETSELDVLVEVGNGRDYKHLNEGRIPVYGTGGYMLSVDQALSYNKDAIGIGRKGTIDKPYLLRAPFWTVDTLFFVMAKSGIDLSFLFSVFQRVDWKSKNTATGVPSLTSQAIEQTAVTIAPSLKEQRAIGELFADLDALIEQHRAKHANLQQTKTALLQRMFPQDGAEEPELRLGGFIGEWQPRIMRDCAEYSKGSGYSKKDITDEGSPVIHYGRLYTNYETAITNVDTFASPQAGALISGGDEVLVPASGETAEDIAIASALLQPGVLIGGDLNVIRPRRNIDPVFLALSLSNGVAKETLVKRAQGKSVVHLRNSDIQDVEISFPTLEEQRAIGEIFSNLDALIAAESRYITQLTQAKTALLQRMFV